MNTTQIIQIGFAGLAAIILIVTIIWALCAFGRVYTVWAKSKEGQADLAEAKFEQQIQVMEAQGRFDAAQLNKQSEIVHAEAIAIKIKMLGKSVEENPGYIEYKRLDALSGDDKKIIYVPTECGLPITEAGRLRKE